MALGVALVAGTMLASDAATRAVARAAEDLYGEADLRVRAFDDDGLSADSVTAIRALPGVAISAPLAERRLTLSTQPGPDEQVFTLLAVGVDPAVGGSPWPPGPGRWRGAGRVAPGGRAGHRRLGGGPRPGDRRRARC